MENKNLEDLTEFSNRIIYALEEYEDTVKDLLVMLQKDAGALRPIDSVVEFFLDEYNADFVKRKITPYEVMALFAFVGYLFEKGATDVLTRPRRTAR